MIIEFGGVRYDDPVALLTERGGRFVELPSGVEVDPQEWLLQPWSGTLAGVLGYEFAWELLDIRAERAQTDIPRVCVGRFERGSATRAGAVTMRGELGEIRPRVDAEDYRRAVQRCIDDIYAGELFEVNYTARFDSTWSGSVEQFYRRLAARSTGDYFGLLDAGDFAVASVSPESFVSVSDQVVETRPIKGTRPRDRDPDRDASIRQELLASEKDRAENVMIVDLMRNDITPVCELGTVDVARVCELETFAGVHHLVSTVRGQLREGMRPIDVLLRCFPAGSITGAPKLRAIEIATEVELDARGAYTGTMFAATPDELRSNVLIRTATLRPSDAGFAVEYGAGGAVVADSEPSAEWREALAKCAPLRRMLPDEAR